MSWYGRRQDVPAPAQFPKFMIRGGKGLNIFSRWLFLWVFPILRYSRRYDLELTELDLEESERARPCGDALEKSWEAEKMGKAEPSLLRALWRAFGTRYLFVGLWKLFESVFKFLSIYYLLRELLLYFERAEDDPNATGGHIYAVGLFLASIGASICSNMLSSECTRIGIQVRAALMTLIYRKSLKLSYLKGGIGDVVNLVADHCNRVAEACVNLHLLWGALLDIIIALVLAFLEIRVAALPALIVIVLLIVFQFIFARLLTYIQVQMSTATTQRIHLMSELLTAMRLIKFFAWEPYFRDRVRKVRAKELRWLNWSLRVKGITFATVFMVPVLCALAAFCILGLVSFDAMRPSTVFIALALFNSFRYPLIIFPMAVRTTLGALTSFSELDDFLRQEGVADLDDTTLGEIEENTPPGKGKLRVYFDNVDIQWDGTSKPSVAFFSMRLREGELCAIVGDVGAGKSSVLAAIMGQNRITAGTRRVYGRIAYVPHDAYLLNLTLRQNILFGAPFDPERYREVIRVCALKKDIEGLGQGDETEIGDRGVNLTLGQRQRVSLARAVYSNADIILLDDVLSSMDAHVGKYIFNKCIKEYLKNKAVVFVTNQLQYLSHCDYVLYMKDGSLEDEGTYDELCAKDVNFAALAGDSAEIEDLDDQIEDSGGDFLKPQAEDEETLSSAPESLAHRSPTLSSQPMIPNSIVQNADVKDMSQPVSHEAHGDDQLNALASTQPPPEIALTQMMERGSIIVEPSQLPQSPGANEMSAAQRTIERNQLTIHSLSGQEGVLSAAIDPETGLVVLKRQKRIRTGWPVVWWFICKNPGATFSLSVIVLFFVVQAVRIVSDWWLKFSVAGPITVQYFLGVYGGMVAAILLGAFVRYSLYTAVMVRKSAALHDRIFKRILRAPMSYFDITPLARILSVFARHQNTVDDVLTDAALQTLHVLPIVVGAVILVCVVVPFAFGPVIVLIGLMWLLMIFSVDTESRLKELDADSKGPIFSLLSVTLEGLHTIRVYHAESSFDARNLDRIDTNHRALFGLMQVKAWLYLYLDFLASLFVYISALFLVVFQRQFGWWQVDAATAGLALTNALQILLFGQRVLRHLQDAQLAMESVEQLSYYGKNIPIEQPHVIEDSGIPEDWPQKGEIEYKEVTLRYQRYGHAVLKKVSFHIQPKEKVVIVGKAGSGKTTLLISLLRIVEASEGQILIDDVDIRNAGLRNLRNVIAVIPQEPVLFSGTIRSNLDPFHQCDDQTIWSALKSVHLDEKIRSMPQKIDTPVVDNGRTFSLGQRQLFCIARAILVKSRIVVFDEATSAVDLHTDAIIRETIRKNFKDHTVLMIARRLNTIIEADKILVMDDGKVAEFDTPARLLAHSRGRFNQLLGHELAEKLKNMLGVNGNGESSAGNDAGNLDHHGHIPKSLEAVFDPSSS
ncbi:uncharacterized protein VTP21DRAFT_1834 [Calcarisporiella thermophila]|uniref:uncharacterized protein n=1 Tax=Calcarisporiella thermophila TaxID=911321 RepID=UPI0037440E00